MPDVVGEVVFVVCNRPDRVSPLEPPGTAEANGPRMCSAPAPRVPSRPSLRSRASAGSVRGSLGNPKAPPSPPPAPARALPFESPDDLVTSRGYGGTRKGFESDYGRGKG